MSPHSKTIIPSEQHLTCPAIPFEYATSSITLKVDDFRPSVIEKSSIDSLQTDLFQCMILRLGSAESGHPFPGLQSFVNCVRKQAADIEVSNVSYVEIVSEKADSKPTLLGIIIARLQKTFFEELRHKYVVVVGDAKTYLLLQAICFEYKSQLKWLIPFPGDWHILFNYQKVLMKPYADAVLKSMAKSSGHRGETS